MRKLCLLFTVLAAMAVAPSGAWAQARGTISGRVVDAKSSQPLPGATVTVQGTNRGAVTDQAGRYSIRDVPTGTRAVVASTLGYAPVTQQVTVAAGQTATADFSLQASALELGGLIVTATGKEQRKRELGSSVGVINTEKVPLAPVKDFSDLIGSRVPGVTVLQSSGTTGAGSRIRIRGSNSLSLSNAPLLVIDGIRVGSDESFLGFGVGGQSPSRLNDLNPENIANIEILKGPAASALYGTAGANGVIVVTTKRGQAGEPQVHAWAEYGKLQRTAHFPENFVALDADGGQCPLWLQARGDCTPVTTQHSNPLEDAATTPFTDGNRRTVGGSVSGGGEFATYFVSAELQNEDGVYNDGKAFGSHYDDMDDLRRVNLRANLTGQVGEHLKVGANVGYVDSDQEIPQADNALYGIVGEGLGGTPNTQTKYGFPAYGYQYPPAAFYDWITNQGVQRFTGSVNGDWRPLSWLSFNGQAGLDRNVTQEMQRIPRESFYVIYGPPYEHGFIQRYDFNNTNINTNLSGTAVFEPMNGLVSTTTAGTEYIRENFHNIYAFGASLVPGIETSLAGATTDFEAGEGNSLNGTLSGYAQEQLAWRDRVFFNAALRGDKNTAFGTDIGWVYYPSFSGSWVISDEPFFPQESWLSNLRLRAAYGQAGLRPGATDALQSFVGAIGVFNQADLSAFTINELGNANLKPERTSEWEFGFTSGLLDNRLGLEATYYRKLSHDALINRPLPPSAGGSTNRFENLGEVENSGFEFLVNAEPVRMQNFDWNVGLNGSFNHNELLDLGLDAQGNPIPPIATGAFGQRHVVGYPLGSYFEIPIQSYADANGDGLLSPSEVVLGVGNNPDSVTYAGNPFPKTELSLNTDITLFRWIKVSGLFDYKGGYELVNSTRAWRCSRQPFNCEATYDKNTPLAEQAAIVAYVKHNTYTGFVEDASFLKFRELSLTFALPEQLAHRFGSKGLSLTLAGRNLATWTDYKGLDPEVNFAGQSNFTSGDFFTLPPNRTLSVRIDANF